MIKKITILSILVASLSGCKLIPVQPTAKYTVNMPYSKSMEVVFENAKKCWSREFSFFGGDAFVVEKAGYNSMAGVLTVRRSAPDIGYQQAFTIVTIQEKNGKSEIDISEGSCAYDCEMNFTPDVKRWLNGDQTCKEKI